MIYDHLRKLFLGFTGSLGGNFSFLYTTNMNVKLGMRSHLNCQKRYTGLFSKAEVVFHPGP